MQRAELLALGLLALACLPVQLDAASTGKADLSVPNPIRKVVNLLTSMQQKVEEEGRKEKELYAKFECYCTKNSGALSSSVTAATAAIPSLEADIKSGEEQKTQLQADLKQAQVSRDAAKQAIAEATGIREKQAAAYAAEKADYETNTAAIAKAVASLEKGAASSFLQTRSAQVLQKLVFGKADMLDADRQELASFLAGQAGSDYAPQGGQVTGILKQLGDEMAKSLADLVAAEEAAIASFQALIKAKKAEVEALTSSIETKTLRVGELGVTIVQWQNDLKDTQNSLAKDQAFLAELASSCSTKGDEMKQREETRSQELLALAETIKLLNDDDALDLFKNTLSLVQLQVSGAAVRARALTVITDAQKAGARSSVLLDRLVLVLRGKKIGFEKVIEMVDGMVELLKKEQLDDDHKQEYCAGQFDLADDKKKALETSIADSEAAIESAQEGIAKVTEEIASLEAGLKELDQSVATATAQRQKENEEYKELLASDKAAVDLLGLAKNRLNKFYNPKLYKEAAKKELSADDRIVANLGGTVLVQISAHQQGKDAPEAPPETFSGAYGKKSEESTGVIAMIDMLIQDLDKEVQQAAVEEKNSQAAYEQLTKDAAAKRAADSQLLTEKEATKASLEGQLQSHKDAKTSSAKELGATLQYIQSLHAECDWLLQYFDTRKEARTAEVESLEKAKAVLSGASYSLVQTSARRGFLGRQA